MSMLVSCPQCGCSYPRGGRCPQCRYSDNPDLGTQEASCAQEYRARREVHKRHYMIYMGLIFALTTVTIMIIGVIFGLMRAPRLTRSLVAMLALASIM